ncbi:hypothetical protein [Wenyingzhuangia sp. IMCC45467]
MTKNSSIISHLWKVIKNNTPEKKRTLYSILNYLKEWEKLESWGLKLIEIEEDAQKKGIENFDIIGKINSTSFSDSIVVSVRVDNNVNEMLSTLIVNLAYIGSNLLENGILFRGGITIGDLVHNESGTVFGQGLIDAYLLESNSAIYPRIILSDKLIKKLNYPLEAKKDRYPYHQYLQRFNDGCVGVHQLIYYQVIQSWTEISSEELTKKLDTVRKIIIQGLDSSFQQAKVFEKFKWLSYQYEELIILDDIDFKTKQKTKLKFELQDIKGADSEHNIHFSYIDKLHQEWRENKPSA